MTPNLSRPLGEPASHATMTLPSTAALVAALKGHRLLEPAQTQELEAGLAARYADSRSLAAELLRRGWLTAFQVNQLLQGQGDRLAIGSYVLIDRLGQGGMGTVYRARHAKLDRLVALKLIRQERLSNPEIVRRFRREIEAASHLNHPNIVRALDADEVNGSHALVMEHVEGTDLSTLLKRRGPLAVADACEYARQAALGLEHARTRGLTHRDVKPSNLILTADGNTVKVLDFGLARLDADADATTLTESGAVMGTPDYIAPEQAVSSRQADPRSDIYSLGCTLFHLLTGSPPYPGGTVTEKLLRHHMHPVPSLSAARPDVPEAIDAIVRRMMAKQPEDRYQTAGEVAAALAEALRSAPGLLDFRVAGGPAEPPRPPRRWPWALAGVLAAASFGVAFLSWPRQQQTERGGQRPLTALERLTPPPENERQPGWPLELVAAFGDHRWRAWDALGIIRVTPGGQLVGKIDRRWCRWDLNTGEPLPDLPAWVKSLCFSPDGSAVASPGDPVHHLTAVWSLDGVPRVRFPIPETGCPLAFSPDSKMLVTRSADGRSVQVWELSGAKPVAGRTLNGAAAAAVFSPDGKRLILCGPGMEVGEWTPDQAEVKWEKPARTYPPGWDPLLSPDGRWLYVIGPDQTDRWSLTDPDAPVLKVADTNPAYVVVDGNGLTCVVRGILWRYPPEGAPVRVMQNVPNARFAPLPDGKRVAFAIGNTVRVLDPGAPNPPEAGTTAAVTAVALPPGGQTLVAYRGTNDGAQMTVRDLATGEERTVPLRGSFGAVTSLNGSRIAIQFNDRVEVRDLPSGDVRTTIRATAQDRITNIDFGPDGRWLVGLNRGQWQLWELTDTEATPRPEVTTAAALVVGPGGRLVVSGKGLMERATGKRVRDLGDLNRAVFRPDGKALAGVEKGELILLPLDDPMATARPFGIGERIHFSPDGRFLVALPFGAHYAYLNDPVHFRPTITWKFAGLVKSAAFADDGRHLALGNGNGTVYVLRLKADPWAGRR